MKKINTEDAGYIRGLVERGGPTPDEYDKLNSFFIRLGGMVRDGSASREEVNNELWLLLGDAVSSQTMQGKVAIKSHGYAGDFEVIDNIYSNWISPKPLLAKWDHFFHSQSASIAVRNRKKYFIEILKKIKGNKHCAYKILSVASGPARDIYEFCSVGSVGSMTFDCVDMDSSAIEYSRKLCKEYCNYIDFHCKNIFRYKAEQNYNLVWAAGLFDYLDDKRFIYLLKHICTMVSPGGSAIVGNFSKCNPSRDYMESGDWYLFHRSEEELHSLAIKSGIDEKNISIKSEPENVNLFMHISK